DRRDPLTHVVIGRALVAAARDEPRDPTVGAAAILGALSPDVDSVIAFSGWDRYVRAHQFGTHSLIGALAMAAVTAIVVGRLARAFARRGRLTTLFVAAAAGALSHIALDVVSGARIAILWPFGNQRVSLPLVAVAEPWLLRLCVTWPLLVWPCPVRV